MEYILTNEGLRVFEEKGLKKIIDDSFEHLNQNMMQGMPFEDDIDEYAKENNIPDLAEKIEEDETFYVDKRDSFIMHSEIACNLLKDKLPKNLEKDIKNAISAYYLYHDKFLSKFRLRGSYVWRDEQTLNCIMESIHGDMIIEQYDITPDKKQQDLFNYKPLVKRVEWRLLNGFYPEWINTLSHFITFCCQIGKPVPFRDTWEQIFYMGNLRETEPAEVAKHLIEGLKYAKEEKEYSHINVLPFIDNPLKHIKPEKNIFNIYPVRSNSGYASQPFIDKDTLVYLHQVEKGIKFLDARWGDSSVRFNYEQIQHAIKGVVTCIQKRASRCQPYDPGLVFKYFPYERFKRELKL